MPDKTEARYKDIVDSLKEENKKLREILINFYNNDEVDMNYLLNDGWKEDEKAILQEIQKASSPKDWALHQINNQIAALKLLSSEDKYNCPEMMKAYFNIYWKYISQILKGEFNQDNFVNKLYISLKKPSFVCKDLREHIYVDISPVNHSDCDLDFIIEKGNNLWLYRKNLTSNIAYACTKRELKGANELQVIINFSELLKMVCNN